MNFFILLIMLTLPACAIYSPAVDQGNIVTYKMVNKLKVGMSRNQVRFVMGTPLIIDAYNQNRWDYVYIVNRRKQAMVTVLFIYDEVSFIQYW